MKKKIAIMGVGAMGSRMGKRLLAAGHTITVFNRSKERAHPLVELGATYVGTPLEAAEGQEIVISMVRDDDASRDIWLHPKTGALLGLSRSAIAVESSTLSMPWMKELGQAAQQHGRTLIDAPVAGSLPQADSGQLLYLVGGTKRAVDAVHYILLCMGQAVHHVGPFGTGMMMKLAVNALFGIQVAALAEVLAMTRKAEISDEQAVGVLSKMPITSPALSGIGKLMIAQKFDPMFPIDLVEKDFQYIEATADWLGTASPTTTAVRNIYANAKRKGLAEKNIAAVMMEFS